MRQSGLVEFDDERPAEEARAVAGDGHGDPRTVVDAADPRYPDADGSVEIGITTIDYTIEGEGRAERPVLHVFGRTADDTLEHVRVHEFRPYFYAPTDSLRDADLDRDVITGVEEGYESIRGEALTRIYTRTPRDVGEIRETFEHYEADILFPNRLRIDKGLTSGARVPARRADDGAIDVPHTEFEAVEVKARLRVDTFDIEVDDRSGFPEDGEEPILCLTSHDSYRDEYVVWHGLAPDGSGDRPAALDDHELLADTGSVEVRTFDDEAAMLDAFLGYLEETDPDVLTGWNFAEFDAPYLLDRMGRLDPTTEHDLDPDRLSRVDEVWRSDWRGPNVKGRVVFDLLYGYRRTQFSELDSYRLDAVAEAELGVGKERYAGDIGDLWETDPERLLSYNLRDVELCVEIDRKQGIIPFWEEVASFVGCALEDATTPGDTVDMYVLHKANEKFALPSKGSQEGEEFEGGAVFDPITGVREMVAVLDLASLYPMAMVTMNASPETKVGDDFEGESYVAPNGQRFRKSPDGIMREMVDELLAERERKKARRDEHAPDDEAYARFDRQQAAVKVIMNSLYGVSGWERFRLYDKESAAAVTATGREVIEFTAESAGELGREVLYGDSVSGDRPIVTRDPTGSVRILPIEELFDLAGAETSSEVRITADGSPVGTGDLPKTRRTIPGWEALSVTGEGTPEWQPIRQVIRHETEKPLVKLQHGLGESITTRDHSYVIDAGDELREAPPSEVDEPLRVSGIPPVDRIDSIDLYEQLADSTREHEDRLSVGTSMGVSKTKLVHADDEWVWFCHDGDGDLASASKVKRHVELRSEAGTALLRLLAAYVTEESATTIETSDGTFGVSISESRREWLEQLRTDHHRLFENAPASIVGNDAGNQRAVSDVTGSGRSETTDDDRMLKLEMTSELTTVFFREMAGETSSGKRIPPFVYQLDDDCQRLFVAALVEGGGSRAFPRNSAEDTELEFDFETTSRQLAAGLSILLTQLGRKHSFTYRDEKDSYTVRTVDSYRRGRHPRLQAVEHDGYVYDLSVAENGNFVDAVGGIVLHNTDSVMLELGGDLTKEAAIERAFETEAHINERYDEFARTTLHAETHRFRIEFEKLYRRFFQAGKKKRYAGHIIWKEGNDVDDIDITGFEYKRSDIAPITKRVQQEVIEMIVRGRPLEEVAAHVHDVIEEFQRGDLPLEDVGVPSGIGKRLDEYDTDTAHVRGAKYANLLLGTNFGRGSKPKRLYLEKVHPSFFRELEAEHPDLETEPLYLEFKRDPDVICFEYADQVPEAFRVDWEKMLEKTLQGPIARVLEAVGVSWEEVKSGQEQTGLESFM